MVEIPSLDNIIYVINHFMSFFIFEYAYVFLEKHYSYIITFFFVSIVFYIINQSRFRYSVINNHSLRKIYLLICLVSIVWLIHDVYFIKSFGFEPLVSLLSSISGLITLYISTEASEKDPAIYRRIMLKRVKKYWIKDYLEKSLQCESLIELGLEERNCEIKCSLDRILQTPDKPNCKLPQGTKIIDVFDENTHPLLILGEPGAGKTTILLELARELIARAEKDSNEAIPVVFNLASWKKKSISDWLVDELIIMYGIPSKIARFLVENDKLLLLLDGLDEISSSSIEDCVKEINRFCKHHLVQVVVCSRLKDYEALSNSLEVQSAVLLQPLTKKQVYDYLSLFGPKIDALRTVIQKDQTFEELSHSPLILNIMILAYQSKVVRDIQSSGTVKEQKKHLFDCYVENMFTRRGPKQLYSSKQTIHWLSWIARNMSRFSESMFLIDKIQSEWLSDKKSVSYNVNYLVAIAIGIISGLIGLHVGGPLLFLSLGLIGVFFGHSGEIEIVEKLDFTLNRDKLEDYFVWLLCGLAIGFFDGLIIWVIDSFLDKFAGLLVVGIPLLTMIVLSLETWKISDKKIKDVIDLFFYLTLIPTFFFGLIFWLILWLEVFIPEGFIASLIASLIVFAIIFIPNIYEIMAESQFSGVITFPLTCIFFGTIFYKFTTNSVSFIGFVLLFTLIILSLRDNLKVIRDENVLPKIPNEGIKQSFKSSILSLIMYGSIGGIISGLSAWIVVGSEDVLYYTLVGFSIPGLISGLENGGRSCIQHATLRIILWHKEFLPLHCTRFLNSAVERVFLRKVGGGYIFIHRELLDYFASLDECAIIGTYTE